jgi:hypothetical protein
MQNATIDLNVLDIGDGKNPFNELAAKIEEFSLSGSDEMQIRNLEKQLLFIERTLQDMQDINSIKAKALTQLVNANVALVNFNEFTSIESLGRSINALKSFADNIYHSDAKEVAKYMLTDVIKQNFSKTVLSPNEFHGIYDSLFLLETKQKKTEWELDFQFNTEPGENHKPLEFLYSVIEGFNKLDGVKVTLTDIRIGSLNAKLKFEFETPQAKDEVKAIIVESKELTVAKLEARSNSAAKTVIGEKYINLKVSESGINDEIKQLEIESLRFDVEKKRLENERLQLQIFKEKREILKEIFVDGFVDLGDLVAYINGIPFMKIESGQITVNESIDVIDRL